MQAVPTELLIQAMADSIGDQGWCTGTGLFSADEIDRLAVEGRRLWRHGDFRPAGVGHGHELKQHLEIRQDRVRWLDPEQATRAQRCYWQRMESLRQVLNRTLYLGLLSFEAHLALYPPGAFYRRHLDRFRQVSHRKLSCITYLNAAWQADDGGELRLYLPGEPEETLDILPTGKTTVLFLSDRFEHEVLPAHCERLSITGWFGVAV